MSDANDFNYFWMFPKEWVKVFHQSMAYMCVDAAPVYVCKTRTCFFKSEAQAANSCCFIEFWQLHGPQLVSHLACGATMWKKQLLQQHHVPTVSMVIYACSTGCTLDHPKHRRMPGTTSTENTRKRPFLEAFAETISDGVWGPRKWTSLEITARGMFF